MVFSSLTFLFLFFPAVTALYFVWKNRVWRNVLLLVASLVFYSWGEPKYVLLMLAATLVAWTGGLLIDRLRGRRGEKAVFVLTVLLLTVNLFVFKYLNFAAENLCALFGTESSLPKIALPIGVSFYTFQILSYVIDLKRGEIAVQRNFFYLLLYVSFFPQLIAGPIVRYQTVEQEIRTRRECLDDVVAGLKRFIVGLGKKVILANGVALLPQTVYGGDALFSTAMYWLAALAYTVQIYFDFSGYSDMAIGIGRMFGFHFLENFNEPYRALSVTDFWRRWHISLSSWFRDYVYIPLGGNRCSRLRWVRNLLIVWGLTGLWHGAEWNFVLWGLYYAVLLLAEKLLLSRVLARLPRIVRRLYTLFFVVLGWVLFSVSGLHQLGGALSSLFCFRPTDWIPALASHSDLLAALLYLLPGLLLALLPAPKRRVRSTAGELCSCALHGLLLIACIVLLLSSAYNPFIYFRF